MLLYAAAVAVHEMTPVLAYIVPVIVVLALLLVLAYLGLTKEVAAKTFGQPDQEYDDIDSFTVLVWDRPMHF